MMKFFRKKIVLLLIVVALIGGGFFGYKKFFRTDGVVRYVIAEAKKGTLIISVSGSGQVSAVNHMDVKPKASGDIVALLVKSGQEVARGALIAELDSHDAQKAVRDAQANMDAAQLALEKLKKPAEVLSLLQAEHALAQAKEARQKADDDLTKVYEDGFNTVASAFLDLPTVMAGLNDILFTTTIGSNNQWNIDYYTNAIETYASAIVQYKKDVEQKYQTARTAYNTNFDHYKSATRFSERSVVGSLIDETYATTKDVAEAVKSANNFIQFYKDKIIERGFKAHASADTHLTSLNTFTGKTNTHLLNLSSVRRTIQTNQEAIVNTDRSIAEKTESLAKLKTGADPLDIRSQELTMQQRMNTLRDAQEKLADYFIRAPFAGVIAKLDVKKGDAVGPSTLLASLVTKQKRAEISLNEVDVAKVKVGQKATLTFDAVADLATSGQVAEIDSVGTVSQGVVTYIVTITFDTQDDRVKPGMSVSASIITEAKPDVVLVPNAAVKQQGETQYVERVDVQGALTREAASTGVELINLPSRTPVEIGLANDESTEILNGLTEGDHVVTRVVDPTNQTQNRQQQAAPFNPFGGGGGGRGGGNLRVR